MPTNPFYTPMSPLDFTVWNQLWTKNGELSPRQCKMLDDYEEVLRSGGTVRIPRRFSLIDHTPATADDAANPIDVYVARRPWYKRFWYALTYYPVIRFDSQGQNTLDHNMTLTSETLQLCCGKYNATFIRG